MTKPLISIIIPILNEQDNIPLLYAALIRLEVLTSYDYELIFVDDGSTDSSWTVITNLAQQNPHIRAIKFTRNFGHQAALMAGYHRAQGDAIITMDADFQHPPELIPVLLEKWHEGFPVVYARKRERKEGSAKRCITRCFYILFDYLADIKIPQQVSDFRLIDKKVLEILYSIKESNPYIRGLVAWTGFKATYIDFDQPQRLHGKPGYTWTKMFKLAGAGVMGFSQKPLQLPFYVGISMIMLSLLAGMLGLFYKDAAFSLVLLTSLGIVIGIQTLCLWLIGLYVGALHEQQKQRPLYVVERVIDESDSIA